MTRAEPPITERVAEHPSEPGGAGTRSRTPAWAIGAVILAGVIGLVLIVESIQANSATYDEVAYLRIAATWWRTGRQAEMTRMGSPLTFWKLQQAATLAWLDTTGRSALIDAPIARQAELLPLLRTGAVWIWVVTLGLVAWWARRLRGVVAMVWAAWLFALSPNLLAHAALITMEMPLAAATTAVCLLFGVFLRTGAAGPFWAAAAVCGLAFSCKFTAVVLPPLLGLAWWVEEMRAGKARSFGSLWNLVRGMAAFLVVMLAADLIVTGFAVLPLSTRPGQEHPSVSRRFGPRVDAAVTALIEAPWPQDLVGFVTQMRHQRTGGSSYLLGQRRMHGWWYYYFVALAVKVPLGLFVLWGMRMAQAGRSAPERGDLLIPTVVVGFLVLTALGSSRNYGLRYLLPLSPLAVVWTSALVERPGWTRRLAVAALLAQAHALASIHPYELTYFNELAGGPVGGRRVLADSNLDWGQGLKSLARLQSRRPELRELTLYYFGDTAPASYSVVGTSHVIDAGDVHPGLPPRFTAATPFVAVSASLSDGPWGPPGYFQALEGVRPWLLTEDATIAIYRTADVFRALGAAFQ